MTDYETRYTVYQFGENLLGFGLGNAEIEALHAFLPGTFNSSHGPPKKVFVRETRLNGKDRKMVTASV